MSPHVPRKQWFRNGIPLFFITCFITLYNTAVCQVTLGDFYPFGISAGDRAIPKKDDGGEGPFNITTNFTYYGRKFTSLYINNNGIINLGKDQISEYKPQNFPLESNVSLIAPFWADVDTEHAGGSVTFRQTTNQTLLDRVSAEIRTYFYLEQKFTWMFIATWDDVGFYGASDPGGRLRKNTFQLVLATNQVRSYVIFNYNKLQWTTGSNSQGDSNTGLGGHPAQVGFNAGDGKNYHTVEGAQSAAVINLTLTSNVNVPGKWIFGVSSQEIRDVQCSHDVNIEIQPKVGTMLGGEEFRISGPCFNPEYTVFARIAETNTTFKCKVNNFVSASCIIPPIFRTGEMTFQLNPYGISWNYTTHISITNIAFMKPPLTREDPDVWEVGKQVTVSSSSLPSNYVVLEVLGYQYKNGTPSLNVVQTQTVVITDTNVTERSHTFVLSQNLTYYSAAIVRLRTSDDSRQVQPCVWSDVFSVRGGSVNSSIDWCLAWIKTDSALPPMDNKNSSCPCVLKQASRDTSRFESDPFCSKDNTNSSTNCGNRPGAAHCVLHNQRSNSVGGETCCYDSSGNLIDIRENTDGGTINRYHFRSQKDQSVPFFSYLEADTLPYLHCCKYSDQCHSFIKLRPPATCDTYVPPKAAQASGDPHLTTLDNKSYTFNGLGDFVLVEDPDSGIVVQVRAAQAQDTEGIPQNASIFSGVAVAVRDVSDVVEIHKSQTDISQVFINSDKYNIDSSTSDLKGVDIQKKRLEDNTDNYLVVLDSSSVSLSLDVSRDLINVLVMVGGTNLNGKLQGLLGNFNGNPDDDFKPRNGSVLDSDATMKSIHYNFGMTWKVLEGNSLFLSDKRTDDNIAAPSKETFQFVPKFLDDLDGNQRNNTEKICGSNEQCKFDYQVTGNEAVAKRTLKFSEEFKALQEDIKKVVRCPYLPEIENGVKNVSGYSVGSLAIFDCLKEFTAFGDRTRHCGKDGSWNGTSLRCAEKVSGSDDVVSVLYYAVGSGTGGFVFIVVIILVFIYCHRRRRSKFPDDEESGAPSIALPEIYIRTQHIPQPVFEDDAFLESLQRLNSTDGVFRIPRPSYVDTSIFHEYF